jgi:hypothetical protein
MLGRDVRTQIRPIQPRIADLAAQTRNAALIGRQSSVDHC